MFIYLGNWDMMDFNFIFFIFVFFLYYCGVFEFGCFVGGEWGFDVDDIYCVCRVFYSVVEDECEVVECSLFWMFFKMMLESVCKKWRE